MKTKTNNSGLIDNQPTNTGLKPNKQKIDWEKEFYRQFCYTEDGAKELDWNLFPPLQHNGTDRLGELMDFISQLLKTQREEIISEIIDLVKENRKGTFTDDGGNDCWYIDDLVKELKILENKE